MVHTIERLNAQGDGVADGIRAPLTLPGEVVSGTCAGDLLTDVRIQEPSAARVAAPCAHFRSCGGCQLQHAHDSFVADWKRQLVENALDRVGIQTELRPTLTSPDQSRIRATFAARRTKKGALAGFHARRSDTVIPVPQCILVRPALRQALPLAEELAIVGASRKGVLAARVTESETGLDLAVTGGKPLDGELQIRLAALAERYDLSRLSWDDDVIAIRRPPYHIMGRAQVVPPPGAFLQATRHGQSVLVDAVREIIGKAAQIADLFSGCGTFTLPLAETAQVNAFEGDADMVASLDQAWRKTPGLKRVQAENRDLFRRPLMANELAYDAVVIDPPRAGAAAQVSQLAQSGCRVIAYVSCNPETFARDAKTLINAGYRLDYVQPVDQFRWSAHVELVAAFSLPHMRG